MKAFIGVNGSKCSVKYTVWMRPLIGLLASILFISCKHQNYSTPDETIDLPYTVLQQEEFWCWAGVTQAVIGATADRYVEQCVIANQFLGRNDCCQEHNQQCNQPQVVHNVLTSFSLLDRTLNRPLKSNEVHSFVSSGRPVVMRVAKGEMGHVVVIYRSEPLGQEHVFNVWDPDRGDRTNLSYSDLIKYSYQDSQWQWVQTHVTKTALRVFGQQTPYTESRTGDALSEQSQTDYHVKNRDWIRQMTNELNKSTSSSSSTPYRSDTSSSVSRGVGDQPVVGGCLTKEEYAQYLTLQPSSDQHTKLFQRYLKYGRCK